MALRKKQFVSFYVQYENRWYYFLLNVKLDQDINYITFFPTAEIWKMKNFSIISNNKNIVFLKKKLHDRYPVLECL